MHCTVSNMRLVCLLMVFRTVACSDDEEVHSPDENATPAQMAKNHGYYCETHEVVTEDGYILTFYRIPGGLNIPLDTDRPPALLHHGLIQSGADFLMCGPKLSLGYLLADAGYDVWLGNCRGNTYSKNHTSMSSDDVEFWDFSWHEMGVYDLPAVIDYMLQVTGHEKIYYIGHSMGTTIFFVLCTMKPEYNDKIRFMVALAPVAFTSHVTSALRCLAPFVSSVAKIAEFFGVGEFLEGNALTHTLFKAFCTTQFPQSAICKTLLGQLIGFNEEAIDKATLRIILGHNPAGASIKTIAHYAQGVNTGTFAQYDYGTIKNMLVYKKMSPPEYNLSLISCPMACFFANNDILAENQDFAKLNNSLTNSRHLFRVKRENFNHEDFLWAKDVKSMVYNDLIEVLKKYW